MYRNLSGPPENVDIFPRLLETLADPRLRHEAILECDHLHSSPVAVLEIDGKKDKKAEKVVVYGNAKNAAEAREQEDKMEAWENPVSFSDHMETAIDRVSVGIPIVDGLTFDQTLNESGLCTMVGALPSSLCLRFH